MSETYVACLVARKPSVILSFLKILLIMLTVVFLMVGGVFLPGLVVAIITGVGAYFATMNANIEWAQRITIVDAAVMSALSATMPG